MIELSFHGAADTVTGSKYLLRANDEKILIDCGMFQGAKELRQKNWTELPFDATSVKAVILTHAHVDHIGILPRLVKCGFKGEIFATAPTVDLAKILLADSARIQEEDADYRNRKGLTSHSPALPLFTSEDAERTLGQFVGIRFGQWTSAGENFKFRYHVAGHILGAASVEVLVTDGATKKSIFFSGDIGRYSVPLIIDPAEPPETDYLVCEATYGGKVHPPSDPFFELSKLINDVVERKSVLLIPAFAVGRTQQLIYMINVLLTQKQIPPIKLHVDSPMAVRVTNIYSRYPGYHSINVDSLKGGKGPLGGKQVTLHRKRKSSKTLNKLKGPAIILSASGMLSGGRILHHLLQRLPDPNTTLALVGFMAHGTLGRKIQQGDKTVYIHKTRVEVKARIVHQCGLSGHADYMEILHWLEPINGTPRKVFLTHGESSRCHAMAETLTRERGWDCHIPELHETVLL